MPTRAYLRLDPQFRRKKEAYPDGALAAYILMLCAAEGQPRRGRFESVSILRAFLGVKRRRWVPFLLDHHDLIEASKHRCPSCPAGDPMPGELYVDGWDEWQEGDFTVAERVARFRRKNAPVTPDVTPPVTAEVTPPVTPDRRAPRATSGGGGISGGGAPLRAPPVRIPTDDERAEARAAAQSILDNAESHPAARAAAEKALAKLNGTPTQDPAPVPASEDVDFGAPPAEGASPGEQVAPDA